MIKLSLLGIALVTIFCLPSLSAHAQTRCSGKQISVSEGEGESDMGGKRYGVFEFTNKSDKPCGMAGFPGFAALDRSGKVMKNVPIQYTNNYPNGTSEKNAHRKTVTLEPGKKARFQIYYNDGMAIPRRKPYPEVKKVRISAPKDKRSFVLTSRFTVCCGIKVGSIASVE